MPERYEGPRRERNFEYNGYSRDVSEQEYRAEHEHYYTVNKRDRTGRAISAICMRFTGRTDPDVGGPEYCRRETYDGKLLKGM